MSLEGNIRDLQLQEVFQLLSHGRKTGTLRIVAQLAGLAAIVCFSNGAIVDCVIDMAPLDSNFEGAAERTKRQVESAALELLTWSDGTFTFAPAASGTDFGTDVRIGTEMLLVEGARRIEAWARLGDRIPHARVVPTFVTAGPQQLPLLHLEPQQWEVLTGIDGTRDLPALADALKRDLLDVAETVHGLLVTGLLALVEGARPVRVPASATRSTGAVAVVTASTTASLTPMANDVWVPPQLATPRATPVADDGYNAIFDPVRVGVITPEGLPRLRTPLHVAKTRKAAPSHAELRHAGDAAAKRGDFTDALSKWSEYLKADEHGADADHVREAIALTARLHALLYTTTRP